MQIDQAVDGSLHLGGIILTNLGGHGCSAIKEMTPKNGVGGGGDGRRVVPEAVNWRRDGKAVEVGVRESPGLFRSNTVEARHRSAGLPARRCCLRLGGLFYSALAAGGGTRRTEDPPIWAWGEGAAGQSRAERVSVPTLGWGSHAPVAPECCEMENGGGGGILWLVLGSRGILRVSPRGERFVGALGTLGKR